MIGFIMLRRVLLLSALLISNATTYAQVGIHRIPIFEDESVKRNMAAKAAADARREREAAETIQRERKQLEQVQFDYAAERERERIRVSQLPPDVPDTQSQIDIFNCTYPINSVGPASAGRVDSCLKEIISRRDAEKRAAIEEEQRLENEKIQAEQARFEEERRKSEAAEKLAAELAAKSVRESAEQSGRFATLFGFIALLFAIYKKRSYGWKSMTIAIVFGGLSGVLVYFIAGMSLGFTSGLISPAFASVVLFSGWILSIHMLLKGTVRVSKVLARSFLLGAAEWLLVIPMGVFTAGRVISETTVNHGGSTAAAAGAAIGGGLFAFITGGVAVAMAVLCLISYSVTYFLTREMKSEDQDEKKKCPECAEYIQSEARKCRFCGAVLADSTFAGTV